MAVEEGHYARLDGRSLKVKSDTTDDNYRVRAFQRPNGAVEFQCDHPIVRGFSEHPAVSNPAGVTPCKHAAVAARRLERVGLIELQHAAGLWIATEKGRINP